MSHHYPSSRKMLNLVIAQAPAPLWTPPRAPDPAVRVWRDAQGKARAYGQTLQREHWMHWPGLASFCFSPQNGAVRALVNPAARRELIWETYRREVLPLVLQVRGIEVLRASAILGQWGAVAFCGPSGMGKSALAFALNRRGCPLWGDDAVALDIAEQRISTPPLPFSLRLDPAAADYFGQPVFQPPPVPAWPFNLAQAQREAKLLAALIVLERASTASAALHFQAVRLLPTKAFAKLLPYAYCFNPDDEARKSRMLEQYLEVCARVPVYWVRFRPGLTDYETFVTKIEELIRL